MPGPSDPEAARAAGPDHWETLTAGPVWAVDLLQGLLEQEGIPVFLPDHTTKIVDPFITGGYALAARLQVPASRFAEAERVLEDARKAGALAGTPEDGADEEEEVAPEEEHGEGDAGSEAPEVEDDVEWLATRARWLGLLGLTAPLALFYGACYLLAVRREGRRSSRHLLTLLGILYAALLVTWFALVLTGVVRVRTPG